MKEKVKQVYPSIYYCSSKDNMSDDTEYFLKDFYEAIDITDIDLNAIPF